MRRTRVTFFMVLFLVTLSGLLRAQMPAGPNRPAGVPDGYVITPFGYFHPSCVLQLAKGETLLADGRVLQHTDGSVENVPSCDYPHYAASGEIVAAGVGTPTISHSWIEDANTTTSTSYGELTATWTVPPAPTSNDGQTVYFFPGLEDFGDVVSILQPVLGWYNGAWSVASWNCCPSGITVESPPVGVSSGDEIQGTIQSTCSAGTLSCSTWNVTSEDVSNGLSTQLANTPSEGQTFNWAFAGVLEVYDVSQCSDYPPNGSLAFNATLYDYNLDVISNPGWLPAYYSSGLTPQCGYSVQTTAAGAVLIYAAVATLPATSITSDSATLNGTVNPNGSPGNVYFYYGTSATTLNLSCGAGSVVANYNVQPFLCGVGGFQPNTTYYFQIVFYNTNSDTYTYGSTLHFLVPLPKLVTKAATSVTSDSGVLNGTVNPNGSPGNVYFYYGTSATTLNLSCGAGSVVANYNVQPFLCGVGGLQPNTTYYYQVVFYDTNNDIYTYGTVQKFKVLLPKLVTKAATSITSDSGVLNGTVNPNGSPGNVYFYYGTSATTLNLTCSAGSVVANYNVQPFLCGLGGLQPNTTYYFQIVFYDTNNDIYTYGTVQKFNVLLPKLVTEAATSIASDSATLNSTVNPNGSPGNVYFYYGTSATTLNLSCSAGSVTPNYDVQPFLCGVAGLQPNTGYYFQVVFYDTNNDIYTYGVVDNFETL